MTNDPKQWIAAFRNSHERLRGLVEPLDPARLTGPSFASEWTIAQVLSHLGSGAEIFSLLLEAGLAGDDAPEGAAFQPIWAVWDAKAPEAQAADAVPANAALVERLEGLDQGAATAFHLDMFGMELDLAGFTRMRVGEHAVHTWDVAVMLDPEATVSPDAVALLAESIDQRVAWHGKPLDAAQPPRLHMVVTDPAAEYLLSLGDPVTLSPWEPGLAAVGELRLPAEVLLRLVYGRLTETDEKAVEFSATSLGAADLRRAFPGF